MTDRAKGADRFRLDGRVAVVTGSTKGIGRALVEGLAAAGASIVVSSRDQARCDLVAADLAASTGAEVLPLACHVGDWGAIPVFVDAVVERFGRIDVLVNNAGIMPPPTSVSDMDLGYWRKVFAVNLEGPLRMSQSVAPHMLAGGGGSIIHVGSMAAYSGGSLTCAYAAAKAALVNLTKSMAIEWVSWGIRVNIINPGSFRTDMTLSGPTGEEFLARMAQGIPMGRVADAEEIVGPALYLASDASSFVTGEELAVSGGKR